jgi:hypothetical protein
MGNILKVFLACLCIAPLQAQIYSGKQLVEDGLLHVSVQVDVTKSLVEICMTGPSEVWFAFGFGTEKMKGSYALVTTTSGVEERFLDGRNEGELLPSSIEVVSDVVAETKRSITIKRKLTGMNDRYFTFPNAAENVSLIYAVGKNEKTNRKHVKKGQLLLVLK